MQTVLAKIVADKAIWVEARKQQQPLASFQNEVVPTQRNFYDALAGTRTAFILECKKASPSKGLIRDDFDPAAIAGVYKHYASAISVLCDEKYFQGSFDFLPIVSKVAPQPILCKDFTIDPYQIYLARYYQADACLLMLSVLDDEQYRQLSAVAHSLNMGVLTEVSNEEELERAIALKAKVVGINNRDLRDMSIDLADLNAAVKRVLLGENKVCGLTRPQDAQVAYESGAIYGGLIFVPTSPRAVNDAQAKAVIDSAPLSYVGVFRNTPVAEVVARVENLSLAAVQLHGSEDQAYIDTLRAELPATVQIWKALSVGETLPQRNLHHVDKYVFDNGQGGTGQRFDWSLLQGQDLRNVLLAGGLGADNCVEAAKSGCAGLDFNSGVESQPGIKDASKLSSVFQTLRAY